MSRATATALRDDTLRITEIFYSLQGESRPAGRPTAFIRLTGCPLRCSWCDTAYAFSGGQRMAVDEILGQVAAFRTRHVCVTGGEPLAQPAVHRLLAVLADAGYQVSLETSGALDIADVDPRVHVVLDIKPPASGELASNRWENIPLLKSEDQIKFVVADRADYEWVREQIAARELPARCEVLLSPAWEQLPAASLAEWILADHLPVRFQIQLHKVLWGEGPGR